MLLTKTQISSSIVVYRANRMEMDEDSISTRVNRYEDNLTLTVLVTAIDAQWEVMGDVGSARYEPALLPPCLTIRVLSYSN